MASRIVGLVQNRRCSCDITDEKRAGNRVSGKSGTEWRYLATFPKVFMRGVVDSISGIAGTKEADSFPKGGCAAHSLPSKRTPSFKARSANGRIGLRPDVQSVTRD